MKIFLLAAACVGVPLIAGPVDVQDLLKRSVEATQRDWKEAPNFTFLAHDIDQKLDSSGRVKSRIEKTYQVTMIDGSPYERLVSVNGEPLNPSQDHEERRKQDVERKLRSGESPSARAKRVAKYERERRQDEAMLREMVAAFDYKLAGEEIVNGRATYILSATPKAGYVPKSRDAKVLTGMKGKLWIDKADTQWVKVEGEVVRPVSFYAVATVSPGTRFVLEQEPVEPGIWMVKHFSVHVNSSILWISRNSNEDDHYSGYHRVAGQSARDVSH
jgi:hypothetical protein